MKEFSLKKSMLMLVALFVLGACSTTGSDDDTTTGGGSTGGDTGGDSLSAEATAFLALVADAKKGSGDTETDYSFSSTGETLTYYADVSGTVTGAEYSFDADSVGGNATDGYTADYIAGGDTLKVTATVEDGALKEIKIDEIDN